MEQTPTFTGGGDQLSAVSAKYEIFNRRDPGNGHYQRRLLRLFHGHQLGDGVQSLDTDLMRSEQAFVFFLTQGAGGTPFDVWRAQAAAALGDEATMEVLDEQIAALAKTVFSLTEASEIRERLIEYQNTYDQLLQSRDAILDIAGKGAVLSVEYAHERPLGEPTLSTMRMIYEVGLQDGKIDLTANASATLFHPHESLPIDVGRVRDWSLGSQVDIPVGSIVGGRNMVFTVAGRFEWLLATPGADDDGKWYECGRWGSADGGRERTTGDLLQHEQYNGGCSGKTYDTCERQWCEDPDFLYSRESRGPHTRTDYSWSSGDDPKPGLIFW